MEEKKRKTVKNSKSGNLLILLLVVVMLLLLYEEPFVAFLLGLFFNCIYQFYYSLLVFNLLADLLCFLTSFVNKQFSRWVILTTFVDINFMQNGSENAKM